MLEKYQLPNGMKVLLSESTKSPVLTVQIWVRTGSADEKSRLRGISHFIEHLVFKGTESFGVGEIASTVEGSGGELNAYTSFDETVFHVTLSKEFEEVGLQVISQMMGFPTFDSKEIDNEREVVIEEIKRGEDSPHRVSSRLMFETVFKKHNYGEPVIGFPKIIKSVKRPELLKYFQERYVPGNMTLVVVGDVDSRRIKPKIKKYFGAFPKRRLVKSVRPKEPAQTKSRCVVKASNFGESYLNLVWRIPGPTHLDIAALDILALVLGQGDSSRLVRRLRLDQNLVNATSSGLFSPKDGGIFNLNCVLNEKNMGSVLAELESALHDILANPPTAEEFQKAVINFEAEEYFSLETVDGLARKFGFYNNLTGDPHYFDKFMNRVRRLGPKDVLKVARKYLNPKTMSLTLLTSGDLGAHKVLARNFVKNYQRVFEEASRARVLVSTASLKRLAWKKAKATRHKPNRTVLSNGITLLTYPDYSTPTVSVRGAFLGGLRAESNTGEDGLTELFSNVWTTGSAKFAEEDINRKSESLAAHVGAFGGRNSIGLSLDVLAPFQQEMGAIYLDLLAAPRLDAGMIDREKISQKEAIRSRQDNPAQLCIQRFLENMFPSHPYGRDLLGTEASVEALGGRHLRGFWDRVATTDNLTISLAGHIDEAYWVELFEGLQIKRGKRWENNPQLSILDQERRIKEVLKKEQAHVVVGYRALTFRDPRRFTLQIIQSVLAGQGGRLFLELRDKASLAYSVSPMRMEGIDAGYFGGYIGCSPEKVETAIRMMTNEFDRLVEEPLNDNELERAKRYLVGRHDIELQKNSSIASSLLFDEMYGLPFQETFAFAERVKGVTSKDVQSLAREIFRKPAIISVVGP